MKKIYLWMMTAIFTCGLASVTFTSCSSDDNGNGQPDQTDKWKDKQAKYTVMFYGAGGGNVDYQLEGIIRPVMQALGENNNQVRFTVMYSMSKDDSQYKDLKELSDFFLGDFGCTYRYELTPQTDVTREGYRSKYKYADASQVELYKQSTLVDFINWSKKTAPADNYILIPVNHGGGFDLDNEVLTRAIIYDNNHASVKGLSSSTIAAAVKESGTHLKAIYWYGCLMGQLEVLTETASVCDYQFATTHVARVDGYHIYDLIYALNKYPNAIDFEKAANYHGGLMNETFFNSFKNVKDDKDPSVIHQENCDFGCWRSNKIAGINQQVKNLGILLRQVYTEGDENKMVRVDYATNDCYQYERDLPHVDVCDYAYCLSKSLSNYPELASDFERVSVEMWNAVVDACVYRLNGIHLKSLDGHEIAPKQKYFTLGISVYAKDEKTYVKYGSNYRNSLFDKATEWSKWLDLNPNSVSLMGINPCNDSSWELDWLEDPM